jgi:hypothetical protein
MSALHDYLQVKHQHHLELLATLPEVKADLEALERGDVESRRLHRKRIVILL